MVCKTTIWFSLYKQLCVIFVITFIWDKSTCSTIFSLETSQFCGVFVADFQPITNEQADRVHELIEHFQLNQDKWQVLIIKNQLTQKNFHPIIFRSMKYDCFLHVHINFGKDLFSTIPSFRSPLESALYQKALFLIIVTNSPYKLFTVETILSHLERQYRVFVFRINKTIRSQLQEKRKFFLDDKYFFCTFCKPCWQRINSRNKDFWSLKLSSFQNSWFMAEHYYQVNKAARKNYPCRQPNIMYLYKKIINCQPSVMFFQLIVFASGKNFTLEPYTNPFYDYSLTPQLFDYVQYYSFEEPFKYSSPMLKYYQWPSIIYCLNLRRKAVAERDMWTKYVPWDIWGLVGLCFLLLAILNPNPRSHNKPMHICLENLVIYVKSFLKLMIITVRQSLSHKWMLLGAFELLFSTLLSVYENSITVSVVVPLVPKPFLSSRELYNNNYTFVVQIGNFDAIYRWLCHEYNTTENPKVIKVKTFRFFDYWLENYFLKRNKEIKYAIVGYLSRHHHYQAVTFVKEKDDTCYQMFPTEEAFSPKPFYFTFASAIASSLQKGVSRLQAAGFLRVKEKSEAYREHIVAALYTRPLIAKYNKEITYDDRKNKLLKDNMITLGNITSIIFAALVIILVAKVSFVAEVVMCHRSVIEQKVRLWVGNGLHKLTFLQLVEVTKRSWNCCGHLSCSLLCQGLRCKCKKTSE